MAENKKATIRRLTVLRDRLLIIGIVLAVTSGVCTVQVVRAEKQPEDVVVETTEAMVTETAEMGISSEGTKQTVTTLPSEVPESANPNSIVPSSEPDGSKNVLPSDETPSNPPDNSGKADDNLENPDKDNPRKEDPEDQNKIEGKGDHANDQDKVAGKGEQAGDQDKNVNKEEVTHTSVNGGLFPTVPLDPPPQAPPLSPESPEKTAKPTGWLIGAILSDILLLANLAGLAVVQKKLKEELAKPVYLTPVWHPEHPQIGKVHCIGARSYQQDSLGLTQVLGGIGTLAMVADGMGGLAGGDQVSQQIIMSGLNYGAAITSCQETNPLVDMVRSINADINRMLGPDLIYKCGSTLIAVLTVKDRFHWISIGDSRIYLYRAGFVNQLNTDHDLMQLWMPEILSGDRSYAAATQDPEGRKVTSFIGMGDLKYMDYSRQAIRLRPGDRLILVTDGVYGAVPPETIAAIFKANQNVSDAAQALDQAVRVAALPHQDNYTALILGF